MLEHFLNLLIDFKTLLLDFDVFNDFFFNICLGLFDP